MIIFTSAIAFYSIMYNVISSQRSQHLLNSANNFIYEYRGFIQDTDERFFLLRLNGIDSYLNSKVLKTDSKIDFILETSGKNSDSVIREAVSELVVLPEGKFLIEDFINNNPYAIIKKFAGEDGRTFYYGKIIDGQVLNELSRKINSEIALAYNNSVLEVSNPSLTQPFVYMLNLAYHDLQFKNNFDLFTEGNESTDIIATIYKPADDLEKNNKISFLIFTTLGEAAGLRTSLRDMFIIIGLAGIILSLILTFLFTDRIRKQITQLSKATEITKSGNFKNKIIVKSKDELGQLANAFNEMLEELEKNLKAKNEYSEFITLINQNPTLSEIAEAALKKIMNTCGFVVGAIYSVNDGNISLTSALGFKKSKIVAKENIEFFDRVIKNKETLIISSNENLPVVSTGVISFEIRYLLIVPVVYNNKVIAILELGSVNEPTDDAKEYLGKIQEQLAIGITNATALLQLENLVNELRELNEDYQKQNIHIRQQNETLIELHNQLKEKAAELEVQKQKAEESTKVKSQFLASMSHELRTPMNSILGLTELILEKATIDDKNRERLEVVFNSGKRLMNLINDILDLSKIEAGKMEIRNENFMLEDLIEEIESNINPLVIDKKLTFRVFRESNTRLIVNTDKGKVTQVLINLLGNAVKFTEHGFVELHIAVLEEGKVRFEVSDSGIGISEEDQKIIFEEFRQIDGTTTRKYSGTGLGLAICKRIADLLKGSISVKSRMGSGTTFTFMVPLNFVEESIREADIKVDVQTLIKNRKNPILVIDDDSEVRYTLGQYLASKGYEVIYADNGDEGIAKAIEHQPFAITLDVMLPVKDGWTVLKELKENPDTKDIPVILISIMGEKNAGYGLGAFEYFVKPISSDKLISAMTKLEGLAKRRIQKIVLVDDDELEFEKFRKEFKDEQVRIEYIQDSELAFNKIAEVQPDLIILDLLMPKLDGVTLSYKLRSSNQTKHIPIIISTAKDLTDEEKKSLTDVVEDITVKSKGHPMDVLKIVRDRIKQQEITSILKEQSESGAENISKEEVSITIPQLEEQGFLGEVLIVDDDPDTLFTIKEIVESCNCNTTLARSGMECLKALELKTPDLILLDIMMPVMDGFQTLKSIRSNPRWAQIPVFAVTAKAMIGDKEIILRHGFDDYIPKPVNPSLMSFKIDQQFTKIKSTDNEKGISN
jgi:signal transduction histidine kinase/CheY-like chemotaxis protein